MTPVIKGARPRLLPFRRFTTLLLQEENGIPSKIQKLSGELLGLSTASVEPPSGISRGNPLGNPCLRAVDL